MGVKIIKLDDTEVSIILTGLTLAHKLYYEKRDNESMLLSDKLLDMMKDDDVFVSEGSNRK